MNMIPIGVVEMVTEQYVQFSVKESDLVTRIDSGEVQTFKGIHDYCVSKLDVDTYLLLKIYKLNNSSIIETGIEIENRYIYNNKIMVSAEPIGTLCNGDFVSGTETYPLVGDDIYIANKAILKYIFSRNNEKSVSLGLLNNYDDIYPHLDLRKVLTSHIAIVGNTGSGKSTTMRTFIYEISKIQEQLKPLVKFFIFDVHGDYSELKFADHIDVKTTHLPLEKLSLDDWSSALLPSDRTQKPLLNRALNIVKILKSNKQIIYAILAKQALEDTTQESFMPLKRMVSRWYIKALGEGGEKDIQLWNKNYDAIYNQEELTDKLNKIIDNNASDIDELICNGERDESWALEDLDEAFEIVFGEEEVKGNRKIRANSETFMARFRNLKSEFGRKDGILNRRNGDELTLREKNFDSHDKHIFILNLVGLNNIALSLVSTYLARQIFNFNKSMANKDDRSNMHFNYLYLDEAHRYVHSQGEQGGSIFDTIAREGRKFSVYLGIISQIPSELSSVVMSQVGAFFIHRIQNTVDLEYIRKNIPSATVSMVNRLPNLPAGTAVLSGTAIQVPLELKIQVGDLWKSSDSRSPID